MLSASFKKALPLNFTSSEFLNGLPIKADALVWITPNMNSILIRVLQDD